jgi:serine/threonine-protein kinase
MECVDGDDLATLLGRIGRLPADKGLETARKICAGLGAAHAKGIIHRDLKPQNIMLNKRGEVLIMDFGLAAVAEQLTGLEARNGTPAYMSPEQLRGAEVTPRSDIYALGLVLYELFTGRKPYEAKNVQQLISMQESLDVPSMTSVAADLHPDVEKVIRRCLDPDPIRRPSSALSVSAALPGGDPLAAALAAGETPSPELVASAGVTGGLPLRVSIACIVFAIGVLLAVPFYFQARHALQMAPLDLAPDALAQKAREASAALGYPRKPADTFFRLQYAAGLLRHLSELPAPKPFAEWLTAEAPVLLSYREALEPLAAPPLGQVSDDVPAPTKPGMVHCVLDGHGRLRQFLALPYRTPPADAGAILPGEVFQLAGLDLAKFTAVTPQRAPTVPADSLQEWKGMHPVLPATEVTVRTAFWKGQLTEFSITWPWDRDTPPPAAASFVLNIVQPIFAITGIAAAVLLAWRNWKLGRCDKAGAHRLFWFRFCAGLLTWVGLAHFSPPERLLSYLAKAVSDLLFGGAAMWLLYLALEPALRARWPHSIVTWNRVLAGRWNDARVGADILMGTVTGAAIALASIVRAEVAERGDLAAGGSLFRLLGTRQWIAGQSELLSGGVQSGLLIFFIIFGLKVLLKRDWLAALAAALILSLGQGVASDPAHARTLVPFLLTAFGLLSFVLLRYGLITTIVAVWTTNNILQLPLGTNLSTWYAASGVMSWLFVAAVAAFGFWNSLGGRLLGIDPAMMTGSRTGPPPR